MKNHTLFKILSNITTVSLLTASIALAQQGSGGTSGQSGTSGEQGGTTSQQGQQKNKSGQQGTQSQSGTQGQGQSGMQGMQGMQGQMSQTPESKVDEIDKAVNLNDSQRAEILRIYQDAEREMQGGGEYMDEDALNSQVEKVLTSEQNRKWQETTLKQSVEDKIDKIDEAVNLTDDQRRRLTPIIEKEMEAKKEMMSEMKSQGEDYDRQKMMEKMSTIRNDTNKEIESILTKEQFKKYNAMPKEGMRQSGQTGQQGMQMGRSGSGQMGQMGQSQTGQMGRSGQSGQGTQSGQYGQQGTSQSGQTGQMGRSQSGQMGQTGMMTPEQRVDQIDEAVTLTDDQRSRIMKIYTDADMEQQGGGEDMDEFTVNSEVEKVLTPEQAKKWQETSLKQGVDDKINEINEAVNLTDDQKSRLTPIIEKEMKAKKDLMTEMRSRGGEDYDRPTMTNKMSSIREDTNRAIENILTEEQLKKYNAMPKSGTQRQY